MFIYTGCIGKMSNDLLVKYYLNNFFPVGNIKQDLTFDVKVVREMDLKAEVLDEIVYYLNSHRDKYRWAFFFHDSAHIYGLNDDMQSCYYHLFIWYNKTSGSGRFFSNLPFMQFLRRMCFRNKILSPKTYDLYDINVRISHLITSKHQFMRDLSNPHDEIK